MLKRGYYISLSTVAALVVAIVVSCGVNTRTGEKKKVQALNEQETMPNLNLPGGGSMELNREVKYAGGMSDTLVMKDLEGNDMFIMKAVRDSATGEDVAFDVLDAAVITASFTNVAERNGKIDLKFVITVPPSMQESNWQVRLTPVMMVLEDTTALEDIYITGDNFRKAQMRGYQRYDEFLSHIITDTTAFIYKRNLELFLERNMPEFFALKNDSSIVSEEAFRSVYGVSEEEAVEHYTDKMARRVNNRKIARKPKKYARYVRAPYVTEGIRLDTLIKTAEGNFSYVYLQTILSRPKLRKAEITLGGGIFEQDRRIYNIPYKDTLTFYISSVSSFADMSEHYMSKVISRKAAANSSYKIEFALNKTDIDLSIADNASEMERILTNVSEILQNEVFDLDSVVVTASSSPDGSMSINGPLSQKRSESISKYVSKEMAKIQDSIDLQKGFSVDLEGNIVHEKRVKIPFISYSIPENWEMLNDLVEGDVTLTDDEKARYREICDSEPDQDRRDRTLSSEPFYGYLKENLYPRTRMVRFSFNLHRRGMIQDTVTTTELDTAYMKGVEAIRDRDYKLAVVYLSPYQDYNTAIAYVALDRNRSALEILENLERTPQVNYMLAIVHYRLGDDRSAVECYLHSCAQDQSFVYRGNLDPEISTLIKTYGLHKEEEEDLNAY